MKKRFVSLILTLAMALSLSVGLTPAQAADYTPQFTEAAETLYELGLFKGTGINPDGSPVFDLNKPATRMQGLIMLIRLLGEEEAALAYEGACPFTDVSGNSAKYAAYAYSKGYTGGTTATTFGNGPLKSNAFLTFVLRALGYDDKEGDFTYGTAFAMAADKRIIEFGEYTDQSKAIYRDACAQIAYNALLTPVKGETQHLQDKLMAKGTIDAATAKKAGMLEAEPVYSEIVDPQAYDAAHAKLMEARVRAAVAKDAKYFGLPENIHWIAEPKTEGEFMNDVYCCYLVGDYQLLSIPLFDEALWSRFAEYLYFHRFAPCSSRPELLGTMFNGEPVFGDMTVEFDNYFRMNFSFRIKNASLTNEQLYQQQKEAMAEAYAIHDKLHSNGSIKAGMSKLEIIKVYYDYLDSLQVKSGDDSIRSEAMKYDTVYSCLINKQANCMGRAAAFNVLMHLEDITAVGVWCGFKSMGPQPDHIVSIVVVDGVEYTVDWGMRVPIQTLEESRSILEYDEESLSLARAQM